MNSEQKSVRDWMHKFGQETPEKPCIPSHGVLRLRARLLLEECFETISALGFRVIRRGDRGSEIISTDFDFIIDKIPNLEAIADGCADLRVVTVGTEVACGIPGEETFKEVMRSNHSKLWTENEVRSAQRGEDVSWMFRSFDNTYDIERVISVSKCTEKSFLVKDKFGKVLKSPSHSPANLTPILSNQ